MGKRLLLNYFFICCLTTALYARTYTETEGRAAWSTLQKQPLTEQTFREACDLLQDIGQTNLNVSYELLAAYVPVIKKTGNRQWIHVLLMGWAKAKESLNFFEEADSLYREARANTLYGTRMYNEAMVSTVLLYVEWVKTDSLLKYIAIGKKSCRETGDKENLSFIYTFGAFVNMGDTASMRKSLDTAIALASGLPDKNALFTADYDRAVIYNQFGLQQQVEQLEALLELASDSTLTHKPRLYQRTAFYFRNPVPSIYYQLMQVNLLLTDYDNAWKFAELFYNATIKPNPASVQAPYFNSVLALVKCYQGDYVTARSYLSKSFALFNLPEDKIPYTSYYLAAGMLADHEQNAAKTLSYFETAYKKGGTSYGLHVMPPEIYYARALIFHKKLEDAEYILSRLIPVLQARKYSSIGYYYYQQQAALLKAKGDYPAYSHALDTFYTIKDSLASINHYRSIQEVETRLRVHDKESQIALLNEENAAKQKDIRKERIYFSIFSGLFAIIILLLISYSRNQRQRKKQAEQIAMQNEVLQENKIIEMQKQYKIDVMQGAIDAEEKERYKIADQLHDEVGGMLALASLNISAVIEKGNEHAQSGERIGKAHHILSTVSATIRDISHQLTPLVIEKFGFRKAIEDMGHSINLSQKIKLEVVIIGFEDDHKYPASLLNNLYRIVQELLHNILKHAQADSAILELVEHANLIALLVEDNGIGIDDYTLANGKGIKAIQSRIAYLNGNMEIQKKKDNGTLVVIEINV